MQVRLFLFDFRCPLCLLFREAPLLFSSFSICGPSPTSNGNFWRAPGPCPRPRRPPNPCRLSHAVHPIPTITANCSTFPVLLLRTRVAARGTGWLPGHHRTTICQGRRPLYCRLGLGEAYSIAAGHHKIIPCVPVALSPPPPLSVSLSARSAVASASYIIWAGSGLFSILLPSFIQLSLRDPSQLCKA